MAAQFQLKYTKLQIYEGLELKETSNVVAGDIIVLSGIDDVNIGDTITTKNIHNLCKEL